MRIASLLLLSLLLAGCGSSIKSFSSTELDEMSKEITVGMPYSDVIDKIGEPEADNYDPEYKSGFLMYIAEDRVKYLEIRFEEEKVTEVIVRETGSAG